MFIQKKIYHLVVFALFFIFAFSAQARFQGACEYVFLAEANLDIDHDVSYHDREELQRDIEKNRTEFWTQHRAKGIYRFWSSTKEGIANRLRKKIFQPRNQETPFRYKDENPVVAFSIGLVFDEEISKKKAEKDQLLLKKASLLASIDALRNTENISESDRVELLKLEEELENLDHEIEEDDKYIASITAQQQKGLDLIDRDLSLVKNYTKNINSEIVQGLNLRFKIRALKEARRYFLGYELHPEVFEGFWSSFFREDPNNHSLILREYTKWMVNWGGIDIFGRMANFVETRSLREREVIVTFPKYVQESPDQEGEWKEERIVVHTRPGVDAEIRGARNDLVKFRGGFFRKYAFGFGLGMLTHERDFAEAIGRLKEFSRTIGRVFNRYKDKDASFEMPASVTNLRDEIEYNINPSRMSPSVRGRAWLAWQLMRDEFRARRDAINEVSKIVLDEYVQRTGTAQDVKAFEKEFGVTDRSLLGFAQGFFRSILRRLSLAALVASTAVAGVFFQQTIDGTVYLYHKTQDVMLDQYYEYVASDETRIRDIISGRFLDDGESPQDAFNKFMEENFGDVVDFAFERDRALLAQQRLKEEGKIEEANRFPIPEFEDSARLNYAQYLMSYFAQEYNQRQRILRLQQIDEEEAQMLREFKREWRSVIFAETSNMEEMISRIALMQEPIKRYLALETFFKEARGQDQEITDQILLTIYNTGQENWLTQINLEEAQLSEEEVELIERLREKRASIHNLTDVPGDFVLDMNSFHYYQTIRDEYHRADEDNRRVLLAESITQRAQIRFTDHDFILDVIMELDLRLAEKEEDTSVSSGSTDAALDAAQTALEAAQAAVEAARQATENQ